MQPGEPGRSDHSWVIDTRAGSDYPCASQIALKKVMTDYKGKHFCAQPAHDMPSRAEITFLHGLGTVAQDDSLLVRCGRCGQSVLLAFSDLLGLRTFDCRVCRRVSDGKSEAKIDAMPAEVIGDFSQEERSILIRLATGFSDRELKEVYGKSDLDLDELVKRFVRCIRSLNRRPKPPRQA